MHGGDLCRVVHIGHEAKSHFSKLDSSRASTISHSHSKCREVYLVNRQQQSSQEPSSRGQGFHLLYWVCSEVGRGGVLMCAWPSVSWLDVWLHPEQRCLRWLGPCSSLPGYDSSPVTGGGLPARQARKHYETVS